MMRPKIFCDR